MKKRNWKEKTLEELSIRIYPGGTPSRKKPEYWINGTIPWLKISDLTPGTITTSEEYITKKGLEESATKLLPENSLLVSIIGTLGRVGILEIPAAFSQSIMGIQPNTNIINPKYLYYYLNYLKSEIIRKSEKGTHQNINTKTMKKLIIKYCNFNEQKEIITIMDRISRIQKMRKVSKELVNKLMQSSFIKIFGEPFKLFDKYESITLDKISEIRSGITMNKSRREGDNKIPYITVRNLYREEFDFSDLRTISVSESDLAKWKLEYGDLCILEGGDRVDVGRTAVYQGIPTPCVHQNHIFRVRVDRKRFNPFFLSTFLNSDYMQKIFFNEAKATTGISSINKTQLSNIRIPLVPIEKQISFQDNYLTIKKIQNLIITDNKINELFLSLSSYFFNTK